MFLNAEPHSAGKKARVDHRLADQFLDGGLVGHLAFEVGGGRVVVEFAGRLDHLIAVFLGLVEHVGRNIDVVIFGAEGFVVPDHALHAHQVDQALVLLLRTDRELNRHRLGAEAGLDVVHALEEVGADLVHLIGEDDARHLVFVALAPDRLGLRLDALVRGRARQPRRRRTRSERSTSMVKSTWPGVSMMLRRFSFQNAVVAAEVMVMPRSCSCSIQSIVAAPSCTSPILWLLPV